MKVVILAGGQGSRISEESHLIPKPMIEIGGRPILWHIMKHFASYGMNDFIICCGYKGYVIKEYFANYFLHQSDVTFDLAENKMTVHQTQSEDWKVTLVDTGLETMTGGRIARIRKYLNQEPFCLTYGDGLSDINLQALVQFHQQHGKSATVTATQVKARFGALDIKDQAVIQFQEKPQNQQPWINGGFFILNSDVLNLIQSDETIWETDPMQKLVQAQQLMAYSHQGFWQPMDTLRDKKYLEELWSSGKAPWKTWK